MKKFIIILILLFASPVFSATYYMRADGTAANKTAATSCDSASTAMSVALHNAETFTAGDTINLCDDGGDYTSILILPTTGTAGNVITYQAAAGDSPIIRGDSTTITGTWTNTTGNEYSIPWASEPTEIYNGNTQMKGGIINYSATWTVSGNEYKSGTLCKWRPVYLIEDPTGTPIWYTENNGNKGSLSVNAYDCDASNTSRLYIRTSAIDPSTKPAGYIKASVTKFGSLNAGEFFWDASTNLLHVRLADNLAPSNGQLSIATRANCFQVVDKNYITIKNVTCKKTTENGIEFTYTANGGNITLDSVTVQNTGYSGIYFDAADGLTISNITIIDSTVEYFVRTAHFKTEGLPPSNYDIGGITLGTKDSFWSGTAIYDTISLLRNKIDYGDKDISQVLWNNTMRSGTKSALYLNRPTNFTISDNLLIGGDHQLFVNATQTDLYDCGTSVISFNSISEGYDDNMWLQGCNGNVAGDVLIYDNVNRNSGDDNMDIRNMKSTIINNTNINNSLNDGSVFAVDSTGATDVIVKNNLFIRTTPLICTGNNTVCFVDMGNALSNYTFNNNLYYYDGTDTENGFYASDAADLNGVGTFADWQAQTAAPDANSIITADPNLNENYIPISPTPAFNMGQDVCSTLQGIGALNIGSTWPSDVQKIGVCPVSDFDNWDVGAYRIRRLPY